MSRNRAWVDSSLLSVGVLLVVALVVMLNYVGAKYYKRADWTAEELYTLSEKSLAVVEGLERPIEALVFLSPGEPLFGPVRELLSRYAAASDRFSVRVVDPEKNLAEAQQLVDRYELASLDVVILDRGDDRRMIEAADLADYDFSGLQFGQDPEMTAFKGEQAFTQAMLELSEDSKSRIAFTTGHGELKLDDTSARGLSQLADLLRRDNLELEEWAPLGAAAVPAGTDLVVVASPTAAFVEPEVELLRGYLAGGGRLLVLLDPMVSDRGTVEPSGLEELLAGYGVRPGTDIVVDPARQLPFYGAETFFVNGFGEHEITRTLAQADVPVIVPLARSIEVVPADGATGVELLTTSAEAWGERDLEALGAVERGESDLAGPVAIAVAVELEEDEADDTLADASPDALADVQAEGAADAVTAAAEAGPRLVVAGDSDFLGNNQLRNVGNAEFAANVFNWLVARDGLIGIPPKTPEQTKLSLSAAELRTVALLVFLVLPGLAILAGVWIFLRRRR